ncbi:MAG: hypothetical protein OEY49_14415 [Candidatus Heimdallarchaeota archaeon]|nr:hypothetical protein [Candidatus Heimdallarchaeota archaeon]
MDQKSISKKSIVNHFLEFLEELKEDHEKLTETILIASFPIMLIIVYFRFDSLSFASILFNGLFQGLFYALIAIGFAIIFGVARVFNLSIGGFFVFGAYCAYWFRKTTLLDFKQIQTLDFGNMMETKNFDPFKYSLIFLFPIIVILGSNLYLLKKKNFDKPIVILCLLNLGLVGYYYITIKPLYEGSNLSLIYISILIQASVSLFTLGLDYLEFKKKSILIISAVLNMVMMTFNQIWAFQWVSIWIIKIWATLYAPALYFGILLMSIMISAILSIFIDYLLVDKIRSNQTNVLIVTFGVALLIQSIIPILSYPDNITFQKFDILTRYLEGLVVLFRSNELMGITIQRLRIIAAFFSGVFLILVALFINKTDMGRAMRAVSQDPEAAALVGINVRKIYFIANGLAMGLVASAAVLTTPYEAQPGWNPGMGWAPLIFSITVVTLGGLGSIKGSFYAGLLLGFAESIVGILNPELGTVIPLLVILAVLIIKPEGLFGKEEDEE